MKGSLLRRGVPASRGAIAGAVAAGALLLFAGAFAVGRATAEPAEPDARVTPVAPTSERVAVPGLSRAPELPALRRPSVRAPSRPPTARRVVTPLRPAPPAPAPAPPPPVEAEPPPSPPPPAPAPPPEPDELIAARGVIGRLGPGRSPTVAARACALWASDRGDDGASGARNAPLRTVARLAEALRPGQTGCLTAGSTFVEQVVIRRGGAPGLPIRLRSAPGPRAVIRGSVTVERDASHVVVANVAVQGENPHRGAIVLIEGSSVGLVDADVSGPFVRDQNTACVLLNGARDALVDGNRIHNCTRASTRNLWAPGILVASATGATITSNVVYHTLGAGIVLAPNAQRSLVSHNVVNANSSGILLGGDAQTASSGNRIVDNVVSYSGGYNVWSSWAGRTRGRGNVVARNCLWKGFRGNVAGAGFARRGNVVADPRYVNRYVTVVLQSGPCFDKRPLPYRRATARLGGLYPVLGAYVRYRLRASTRAARVLGFAVTGLPGGTRVEIRCTRGCPVRERLRATTSSVASRRLRGLRLARGATIEVRASRPGWVSAYARMTVTGLPEGAIVAHACLPARGDRPVPCGRFGR